MKKKKILVPQLKKKKKKFAPSRLSLITSMHKKQAKTLRMDLSRGSAVKWIHSKEQTATPTVLFLKIHLTWFQNVYRNVNLCMRPSTLFAFCHSIIHLGFLLHIQLHPHHLATYYLDVFAEYNCACT